MSKRLQVVLDDVELAEIQRMAKNERMTVAEWVRHALRAARSNKPGVGAKEKIEAVRAASRHTFPTGDLDQMLDEIAKGYPQDLS